MESTQKAVITFGYRNCTSISVQLCAFEVGLVGVEQQMNKRRRAKGKDNLLVELKEGLWRGDPPRPRIYWLSEKWWLKLPLQS